jgi:hypothetical protein
MFPLSKNRSGFLKLAELCKGLAVDPKPFTLEVSKDLANPDFKGNISCG